MQRGDRRVGSPTSTWSSVALATVGWILLSGCPRHTSPPDASGRCPGSSIRVGHTCYETRSAARGFCTDYVIDGYVPINERGRCALRGCPNTHVCNDVTGVCELRTAQRGRPCCRQGKQRHPGPCIETGGCPPRCPAPTVCSNRTGFRCEMPPLRCGILTARNGDERGTRIVVSCGANKGLRRGMKGRLCGKGTVSVARVFATRADVRTDMPLVQINGCEQVLFDR